MVVGKVVSRLGRVAVAGRAAVAGRVEVRQVGMCHLWVPPRRSTWRWWRSRGLPRLRQRQLHPWGAVPLLAHACLAWATAWRC